MKPLLPTLAALLIGLPAFAGTAAADPLAHPCAGTVDVHCEDDTYGPCVVWVMYLDIVLPADDGPVLCQDNPYA